MFFTPATTGFLVDLAQNNNREWFAANKERYESCVREPALTWIGAMAPHLARLSPHFMAIASKRGGSLMQIHRDIRFSANKQPYKTNIGIQFRHVQGKDVHAPGYYLHIEPGQVFLGVGIWHPDSATLKRIRTYIDVHPTRWMDARNHEEFTEFFEMAGDSLKRSPRGFDAQHPLIEELKRKDFIALAPLPMELVFDDDLDAIAASYFSLASPMMRQLCRAVGVAF